MKIIIGCRLVPHLLLLAGAMISIGDFLVDGAAVSHRCHGFSCFSCHPDFAGVCVGDARGWMGGGTYGSRNGTSWTFLREDGTPFEEFKKLKEEANMTQEAQVQFQSGLKQYLSNLTVRVEEILRANSTGPECNVTINEEVCSTCTPCGEGRYSADCTNVKSTSERGHTGRMVECESTNPFFYPFKPDVSGRINVTRPTAEPAVPGEDLGLGEADSDVTSSSSSSVVSASGYYKLLLTISVLVGMAGFLY